MFPEQGLAMLEKDGDIFFEEHIVAQVTVTENTWNSYIKTRILIYHYCILHSLLFFLSFEQS